MSQNLPLAKDHSVLESRRKIGIIGGGIAGITLAHALRKNQDPAITMHVTVFERESYVGGRIKEARMYAEAGEKSHDTVHTGAQSFDAGDALLADLEQDVGLTFETRHPHVLGSPLSQVNVWNGEKLIPQQLERLPFTWNVLKRVVLQTLRSSRFWDQLAVDTRKIWEQGANWATVGRDGPDEDEMFRFAQKWGISCEPQKSLVPRRCRASFLEELAGKSGATVLLNSTVTHIKRLRDNTFDVSWVQNAMGEETSHVENFDTVVFAHAFGQTDIDVDLPLPAAPKEITYTPLHVTHFISRLPLDPVTFNLTGNAEVPDLIWNLGNCCNPSGSKKNPPSFLVLEKSEKFYLNGCSGESENVYRVVSENPFTDQNIASLMEHNGTARKNVTFPEQASFPIIPSWPLERSVVINYTTGMVRIQDYEEEESPEVRLSWDPSQASALWPSDAAMLLASQNPEIAGIDPTVRWVHREYWRNGVPITSNEDCVGIDDHNTELVPGLFYISGFERESGASVSKSVASAVGLSEKLLSRWTSNS
ncbi:uncharacterized protein N7484_000220 [Penicillium longicatenatum]|uniref:uncharacterized protein n=1 Tax=Penicillium longicatenatum TaxID=1561947 RepID=UPI0025477141|nr:uncharacterized protein N7484_000220 [Penicillium longicatenatum]KAJ5660848.1 hypothetical protein N7484_000220 [Penicillium longicatenatum]